MALGGARVTTCPAVSLRAGREDLEVNLKVAKTLGVKVPYAVLARSTKVIE
jgi:ABC-type uncharacterized transport system substrate-binding protein